MRNVAFLSLFSGLLCTGCIKTYTVQMGAQPPEDAHYIIVQQGAGGMMKVYDCLSEPDGKNWTPHLREGGHAVFPAQVGESSAPGPRVFPDSGPRSPGLRQRRRSRRDDRQGVLAGDAVALDAYVDFLRSRSPR